MLLESETFNGDVSHYGRADVIRDGLSAPTPALCPRMLNVSELLTLILDDRTAPTIGQSNLGMASTEDVPRSRQSCIKTNTADLQRPSTDTHVFKPKVERPEMSLIHGRSLEQRLVKSSSCVESETFDDDVSSNGTEDVVRDGLSAPTPELCPRMLNVSELLTLILDDRTAPIIGQSNLGMTATEDVPRSRKSCIKTSTADLQRPSTDTQVFKPKVERPEMSLIHGRSLEQRLVKSSSCVESETFDDDVSSNGTEDVVRDGLSAPTPELCPRMLNVSELLTLILDDRTAPTIGQSNLGMTATEDVPRSRKSCIKTSTADLQRPSTDTQVFKPKVERPEMSLIHGRSLEQRLVKSSSCVESETFDDDVSSNGTEDVVRDGLSAPTPELCPRMLNVSELLTLILDDRTAPTIGQSNLGMTATEDVPRSRKSCIKTSTADLQRPSTDTQVFKPKVERPEMSLIHGRSLEQRLVKSSSCVESETFDDDVSSNGTEDVVRDGLSAPTPELCPRMLNVSELLTLILDDRTAPTIGQSNLGMTATEDVPRSRKSCIKTSTADLQRPSTDTQVFKPKVERPEMSLIHGRSLEQRLVKSSSCVESETFDDDVSSKGTEDVVRDGLSAPTPVVEVISADVPQLVHRRSLISRVGRRLLKFSRRLCCWCG
ncbi:unnamed protein product [Macrosiphum euphorbiae]|uniref:Uncharacterized protein n=1 Tax=Macrosiphum euphorbiae TaxID=13131 RepID=A0AAV0YAB0_9HEMI|nr:unnamed protein product [Macrosiphum euphorbiae]